MCWVVYIASDQPLPLIGWDDARPAFNVRALDAEALSRVRHHFSLPHVVEAGSHEGCACGFNCGVLQAADDRERAEEDARLRSLESLAEYVEQAASEGRLELYACWIGDEELAEQGRALVSTQCFRRQPFELEERKLLTLARRI